MPTLISTEFAKLRTMRTVWLLLAVAQLLVVAGVSGLLLNGADPHAPGTPGEALAHVGLVAVFPLVLGIMAVAGEYRHRTITDTYLATPRRDRVIAAKLAAYTAAGVAFGLVTSATGLAATAAWLAAKGAPLDLSDAGVWQTLGGGIAWHAAFAAVGVGIGALVRSQTGAIAAALAWIALVEGIVGQLVGTGLARWLPYRSGVALVQAATSADGTLLPRWGAGTVLLGYAALFALLARASTIRRDVS